MLVILPLLCSILLAGLSTVEGALIESDRLREYHARNNTWPPKFTPDTPGWKKLFEHRLRQVAEIDDRKDRYEGYAQTISAGVVAPNFTEFGFGLARAPDDLMEALRKGIRDGLADGPRSEGSIDVIDAEHEPWFVDRPDLTKRVLEELQHYPENWAGLELTPHRAYGFRLYRNQSQLHMHVDRTQTHVISFILHIDSSEDAEPWPILIEDFDGNTHEVILTSGDMLFYESSKCFHGRPHRFNGTWYSSIFVHYYPKYGWIETDHTLERHYAIPPHWSEYPTHFFETPLKMEGTGMKEPHCPNDWCQTRYTYQWSGPGVEGYWIDPKFQLHELDNKPIVCKDLHPKCEEWTSWKSDECARNPGYMMTNCRKACGMCGVGIPKHSEL